MRDEIIAIDKDNNELICKVLSCIDIDNVQYLVYTDNKKLYASEVRKINEVVNILPIENDDIWNKLEVKFKKLCKDNLKLLSSESL